MCTKVWLLRIPHRDRNSGAATWFVEGGEAEEGVAVAEEFEGVLLESEVADAFDSFVSELWSWTRTPKQAFLMLRR